MTAEEYEAILGYPPKNDDLERVNCPYAGEIGHKDCGWCNQCNRPKFSCICPEKNKLIFENGKINLELSDIGFYNSFTEEQ